MLQMLQLGFFEIEYDKADAVVVTKAGEDVLFGRKRALLCQATEHEESTMQKGKKGRKIQLVIPHFTSVPANEEDPKIFEALRILRKKCADEEGFPPYIVFSDKVLHNLATAKPTTLEDFGNVSGIGEHKKAKYGPRFVDVIKKMT